MKKAILSNIKVFLCSILTLFITSCTKESTSTHKFSEEEESACINLAKFANDAMRKHQNNILMADVLKDIDAMVDTPEDSRVMLKEIVVAAYNEVVFSDSSFRERQLVDFANDVHLKCLESMK